MYDMYDKYITEVSDRGAAISSLCIPVIYKMLEKLPDNAKLVDFGSGFSSVVLRIFAKDKSEMEVYSIDTDYYWLNKTREFLIYCGIPAQNVIMWEDYEIIKNTKFDFILFDIGASIDRHHYLKTVVESNVKNNTILWLDDCHKNAMTGNFKGVLKQAFNSYDWVSLKEQTMDDFGRWASYVNNFQAK